MKLLDKHKFILFVIFALLIDVDLGVLATYLFQLGVLPANTPIIMLIALVVSNVVGLIMFVNVIFNKGR